MSAAEQMKISAQQAAIAAGNAVLRGEGDGTFSEAEDAIRLLIAALTAPSAALAPSECLHSCDWWTVLELPSRAATRRDVDAAYRRLALKHHPDAAGTRGAWDDLVAAYETAKLECSP